MKLSHKQEAKDQENSDRVRLALRDVFAAHAITGILARGGIDLKQAADLSYKQADLMMERREHEPKKSVKTMLKKFFQNHDAKN